MTLVWLESEGMELCWLTCGFWIHMFGVGCVSLVMSVGFPPAVAYVHAVLPYFALRVCCDTKPWRAARPRVLCVCLRLKLHEGKETAVPLCLQGLEGEAECSTLFCFVTPQCNSWQSFHSLKPLIPKVPIWIKMSIDNIHTVAIFLWYNSQGMKYETHIPG